MGRDRTSLESSSARRAKRPAKPPPTSAEVGPKTRVVLSTNERDKYVRPKSELEYLRPDWSDERFIEYLQSHAFDVPPSSPDSLVHIQSVDGRVTAIPRAYRLPLLIVACDLWSCFEDLILYEHEFWDSHKFDFLHLSRLCTTLLSQARVAAHTGTLDGSWRCLTLDRFLTRIYLHWFSNWDEWLAKFSKDWGEQIYARNPLKKGKRQYYRQRFL